MEKMALFRSMTTKVNNKFVKSKFGLVNYASAFHPDSDAPLRDERAPQFYQPDVTVTRETSC